MELEFSLESGDPLITNNNIPIICRQPGNNIPVLHPIGLAAFLLLLGGGGCFVIRRMYR